MATAVPVVSIGPTALGLNPCEPTFSQDAQAAIASGATRWLKNDEVLTVLEELQVANISWPMQASERPEGGSLFAFNRKVCRAFRSDKHNWRKKNDGRTIKETHEKLKVGDKERLNCYYAHAEDGILQRRCYWILDSTKDEVVLVHYLRTSTSRVGARGTGGARQHAIDGVGDQAAVCRGVPLAVSRPQRAAAQRVRFGRYGNDTFDESDEEVDPRRFADDDDEESYKVEDDEEGGALDSNGGASLGTLPGMPQQNEGMSPAFGQRNDSTSAYGKYMHSIPFDPAARDLPSLQEIYQLAQQGRWQPTAGAPAFGNLLGTPGGGGSGALLSGGLSFQMLSPPAAGGQQQQHRGLQHDPLGSGPILLPSMSLGIDAAEFGNLTSLNFSSPVRGTAANVFSGRVLGDSLDLTPSHGARPVAGKDKVEEKGLDDELTGDESLSGAFEMLAKTGQQQMSMDLGGAGAGSGGSDNAEIRKGLQSRDSSMGANNSIGVDNAGTTTTAAGAAAVLAGDGGSIETPEAIAQDLSKAANDAGIDVRVTSTDVRHMLHHQESSVAEHVKNVKVATLRRVVAPGWGVRRGPEPSFADMQARRNSPDGGSDHDGGGSPGSAPGSGDGIKRRKTPIATPSPLSAHDRVAVAAVAAAAASAERREERLVQLRHARQPERQPEIPGPAEGGLEEEESELINGPPNPLFRMTSHVVRNTTTNEATAEAQAVQLLKEMSIDKKLAADAVALADGAAHTGILLRNMSIDERNIAAEVARTPTATATAPEEERVPRDGGTSTATTSPRQHPIAFGSDQDVGTTPSNTTLSNPHSGAASRDPSLSSLLDQSLSMHAVPFQSGDTHNAEEKAGGVEERLRDAFALHAARAEAKKKE